MEKIKILIADDLEVHRRRLERLIKLQPNMELIGSASSGYEVTMMAAMKQPDIILMDIQMEHNTAGIEAAKEINKQLPNIKIIMLTVHKDNNIIFAAFQTGIVDYVLKTCEDGEIVDAIQCAHNNRSPIRPIIAEQIRNEFQRLKDSEKSLLYVINIMSELTQSEFEVLRLLRDGKKRKEISKLRYVEEDTVRKQINSILKKFDKKSYKEVLEVTEKSGIFDIVKKL